MTSGAKTCTEPQAYRMPAQESPTLARPVPAMTIALPLNSVGASAHWRLWSEKAVHVHPVDLRQLLAGRSLWTPDREEEKHHSECYCADREIQVFKPIREWLDVLLAVKGKK